MTASESTDNSASKLQRADTSQLIFSNNFAQDNPGRLQDFFDIKAEQLGEGSFGTVHRACCKRTGIVRAVKAIEIKSVKNPVRFEREISIAKQLDHPNVVRLYETFRDAQKIYLLMELCTGGELFDRIVDEAPSGFDELKSATYIRQILSALCYLHAHKFAHRDVKPENFLFQNKSADAQLKLIDFGLACQFEEGKPMTTKAGTAYYVAPDVLKGEYDEKCDVWSAGVISFVLLCGYPPFAGDTDPEILRRVREGSFEFRSPEWDNISQGAKNLVTQMLTMEPALRPSSEALLASAWLKFKGTPEPAPIRGDFIKRLQSFQAHAKLKKVALTAVAQQLPDDAIENLRATFRSLDAKGNGTLTVEAIRDGLIKEGLKVPDALEELLKSVDTNGSGTLDYTEFLAASIDQKMYMQRDILWGAFRTFDLDGDGKITRDELHKVLNGGNVRSKLGAERIDKMIREVDANGDGCVDFDEFCAMMGVSAEAATAMGASGTSKRRRVS